MITSKKRGFLAKAGALLAVAAFAFSATPAQAQDSDLVPPKFSAVTITKLEQPASQVEAASGADLGNVGTPIQGVTFKAYKVPIEKEGETLSAGTNDWQLAIAEMKLDDAQGLVQESQFDREGTTNEDGKVIWEGEDENGALPQGLYLIKETETPDNVIPAGDFLLALPMTTPGGDGWLKHVFVYPKGTTVKGESSVTNAANYVVGDTITWTIAADIPKIRNHSEDVFQAPEYFAISDSYPAGLTYQGVKVYIGEELLTGQSESVDHYVIVNDASGVRIEFTGAGLKKLTYDPSGATQVKMIVETEVTETGDFTNDPSFYLSEDGKPNEINSQTVKYGNYDLTVTGTDKKPVNGAQFRVYLTEDAARAKIDTAYPKDPNGYLTPTGFDDGIWTTNQNGEVSLGGFRDSFYANGGVVQESDDNYQTYWFAQITAPEGQQLIAEPIEFEIDGDDEGKHDLVVPSNSNAFLLPLTGGSGTALLTIVGLGILALVLIVARLRRNAEA